MWTEILHNIQNLVAQVLIVCVSVRFPGRIHEGGFYSCCVVRGKETNNKTLNPEFTAVLLKVHLIRMQAVAQKPTQCRKSRQLPPLNLNDIQFELLPSKLW